MEIIEQSKNDINGDITLVELEKPLRKQRWGHRQDTIKLKRR